ncbi:MAG: hypothetical protein WDN69_25510 [Aliidongia sp.]
MGKVLLVMALIVIVGLLGGGAFLAFWDIPHRRRRSRRSCPMRASRNSVAAALAAVLLNSAALAQIGAPVPLAPPPGAVPAPYPPPPGYAPRPRPLRTPGAAVFRHHGRSTGAPSPEAVGVLGPNNHGFPDTMWQGASRATVLALLPKIGSTTSPALQDLAYRLLATSAAPPAGPGDGSLIGLRAERLTNALGRADTALALLQGLPPAQRGEDLAKVSVDLAFLSADQNGACAQIRARDRAWKGPYWDQGQITCQALDATARAPSSAWTCCARPRSRMTASSRWSCARWAVTPSCRTRCLRRSPWRWRCSRNPAWQCRRRPSIRRGCRCWLRLPTAAVFRPNSACSPPKRPPRSARWAPDALEAAYLATAA